MKDQTDGLNGQDSRFINLRDNSQIVLKDEYGGAGHSDTGHGFVVQADNWTSPPTARLWSFGTNPPRPGTIVYQSGEGTACLNGRTCGSFNHVSLLNRLKGSA